MADAKSKFLVLFLAPPQVIEAWKRTDPEVRREAEQKMQAAWGQWMGEHAKMILSTEVGGKTKRATTEGVAEVKNEITLFSFIEAESHEAAAQAFVNHPHLQIPQSSIQVMEIRPMGPM